MDIPSLGSLDITPRISGILDLVSSSNDGTYEVREYICGMNGYKLIARGNYTDINMMIGSNTCVKIANTLERLIHIDYHWEFGSSTNILFITTIILYVIFLLLLGIGFFICCGFGGKIFRYIYNKKIKPLIDPSYDTCIFPHLFTESVDKPPNLQSMDSIRVTHIEPVSSNNKPIKPLPALPI